MILKLNLNLYNQNGPCPCTFYRSISIIHNKVYKNKIPQIRKKIYRIKAPQKLLDLLVLITAGTHT